jgi:hypothetical protein
MADYITCDNNSLTIETILGSLFDQITATGAGVFRVLIKTYDASTPLITCATKQEFLVLFRQAMALADDGRIAARICIGTYSNGTGLSSAHECGTFKSLDLLTRTTFCYTTDGEIAFHLASIT